MVQIIENEQDAGGSECLEIHGFSEPEDARSNLGKLEVRPRTRPLQRTRTDFGE